ncbi:hypothetical protein PANT_27c00024 [Moesziomyces antarcticus T-34]|uniref:Uncharacterized protein n=1 Tax=Pseudozyma antarctica (strain T-34) TaxID=1151754 RepID=M9MH43_PSEA3|nr:hypothetical protein PANT_27c00024 [Moesziomyces antarcticus T-34]
MIDALVGLNNLTAVIRTEAETLAAYVVSSTYASAATGLDSRTAKDVDGRGKREPIRPGPRGKSDDQDAGSWTVTVGSERGWWGTTLLPGQLEEFIDRHRHTVQDHPGDSHRDKLACKISNAFARQRILCGVPRSWQSDTTWPSIRLYFDADTSPIHLDLEQLSPEAALLHSTRLVLSTAPLANSASGSSFAQHQLQRKLEATQQALREERHKYRSLLAAPSAAGGRHGRRPVVGLGSSQRSSALPSSSPSSGSRSYGGNAPSSDDTSTVSSQPSRRGWQRTLSLVNPTRVQRADPSENDDFVGDHDDDGELDM